MNNNLNEKKKTKVTNRKDWIESIFIIMVAIFINTCIFNVTYVKGDSMNPTLEEGDRIVLKKYEAILNTEEYNKEDIVVFKSPIEGDKRSFIKRIIGIPGDIINISDGRLYVNDEYVKEAYIEENSFTESLIYGENYKVLEDEVYVIGDNRFPGGSNDSRSFGTISLKEIKGKLVFRIFPFSKIGKKL